MLQKTLFTFICFLLSLSPIVVQGQSAPQYHEIAQIGRPSIEAIDWNPKQDLIAVASAHDIWLYDTQLKDVAHLDLAAAINLNQWTSEGKVQSVNIWRIGEIKWSPDGRWLTIRISIYTADTIWQPNIWQIWSWDGTQFAQVMPDRFQFVSKITWSPNASQFAVLATDKVYLFDSMNDNLLFSTDASDFSWNNASTSIALLKSDTIEIIDAQKRQKTISLPTDESGLTQAMWSPDDSKLGVKNNNRLLIWDVNTGKQLSVFHSEIPNEWLSGSSNPIFTLKHHSHKIRYLQTPLPLPTIAEKIEDWLWLPDSKQIMVSYHHPVFSQNHIVVSNVETGKDIYQSPIYNLSLYKVLALPEINELIALTFSMGGYPNPVIWNTTTWEMLNSDFEDTAWIPSPDKRLVAGYSYATRGIRMYNATTLQKVYEFKPIIDKIRSVAWKANSQQLAIASADELQIWDIPTQQRIEDNLLHNGDITSVIGWSKSETYFALASESSYPRLVDICPSIRVWDANNNLPLPDVHISTSIFPNAAWATQTDQLLIVTSPEYTCGKSSISIWNPTNAETFNLKVDLRLRDITWAESDSTFTATDGTNWYLLDAKAGNVLRTITLPKTTRHVEWIPRDNLLVESTYNSADPQHFTYSLDFIDVVTGNLLYSFADIQDFSLAHNQTIIAIAYASGGIEIGSIRRDKDNIIYKSIRQKISPDVSYWNMDWNQQDTAVAIRGITNHIPDEIQNEVLQIWRLDSQDTPETLFNNPKLLTNSISGFAWHPDGKTFATSQNGGIIKIWSLEN